MNLERVSITRGGGAGYPADAPFDPRERFPEFPHKQDLTGGSQANTAYEVVREALHALGLDREAFGTAAWNPLGEIVRPGDTVFIKPNMIAERHKRDPHGWRYVITHGSIIRAVVDYVLVALRGEGRIIVGDAPQSDSDFEEICRLQGLREIAELIEAAGIRAEIQDLRLEHYVVENDVVVRREALGGDPSGAIRFDLGEESYFHGHRGEGRYYGADYDTRVVNEHHRGARQEYMISASPVQADVFINVPKLKTHKKTGITCNLKGTVGITGDKNWLPHYTEGTPKGGGDERPVGSMKAGVERAGLQWVRKLALRAPAIGNPIHAFLKWIGRAVFGRTDAVVRSGNWYGNDTCWRMCLDLNRILLYGNADGTLRRGVPENRKRYLSIVDAMLCGHGRGPEDPDPLELGAVVAGFDPVCVDAVCAGLMGFDPVKIPLIENAFSRDAHPLTFGEYERIGVIDSAAEKEMTLSEAVERWDTRFEPHFGWKGHIEL